MQARGFVPYMVCALLGTALLGLMAGFFFAFAIDVAPAMANLDAGMYVTTQQWINKVVRNAGFGAVYFASAVMPFVAAAAAAFAGRRAHAAAWGLIALVYGGAVFWLTRSVNVPINEAVAQWNPLAPPAEWATLRGRWNEANGWRALASAACFLAALVLLALPSYPGRPSTRGVPYQRP
jgi:uncharacterized membrane protein